MNKVLLIGRLVKEPIKRTLGDKAVCNYSIAVSERKDDVCFFDCVAWEKLAERISTYCHKGTQVGITGRLHQRKYENQYGAVVNVVEILTDSIDFLSREEIETEEKNCESLDVEEDTPF